MQINGLASFFNHLSEDRYEKTRFALINCGAVSEAEILEEANTIDPDGDEWYEQLKELKTKTALYNDYNGFWKLVTTYIESMRLL